MVCFSSLFGSYANFKAQQVAAFIFDSIFTFSKPPLHALIFYPVSFDLLA
jgi:hypothetical protein